MDQNAPITNRENLQIVTEQNANHRVDFQSRRTLNPTFKDFSKPWRLKLEFTLLSTVFLSSCMGYN